MPISIFHSPLFYSALVIAEALGPKDGVIVADIELYDYAPTYVVYEDGVAARMVLMNYLNAGNINVSVTVGGSVSQVTIKCVYALFTIIRRAISDAKVLGI